MAAAAPTGGCGPFKSSKSVPVNDGVIKTLSAKNFKIQGCIGRGAFSEVYRAIHTETNEVLAIKCFRQEMTTRSRYGSSAKEIAIMKVLNHPNITSVKVYNIGRTYVYFGTEYGCFASLHTYVKKRNLLEPEIQKIMQQIIAALDYMHGIGVCHGDLKMNNIICYKIDNGVPHLKVCDFGLFQMKIDGTPFTHTAGTALYMAPEIVLSKSVDITCDLWSAGVIMYKLMFKHYIFDLKEATMKHLRDIMLVGTAPDLLGILEFSSSCADFLCGLLQYDSKKRLQGQYLRRHPFIQIEKQEFNEENLLLKAKNDIKTAMVHLRNNNYGEALVNVNISVLELQIKHNLTTDASQREHLKQKWKYYEEFADQIITTLLCQPGWDPQEGPISNKELRSQLASTPSLLTGFDIGIQGEMYLQEGNINKARELFHEALLIMLPLMKTEPSSPRKKALGIKLEKWINCLEKDEPQSLESDASTVAPLSPLTEASGPSHSSQL